MTAPLVPPDIDLRNFAYMPLDVLRLRDSDIVSKVSGEEFRCAVLLWCASWHQRPAASLPDDDAVLANLAGFGRSVKEWLRHKKGALHGWIKCDDGRLYHPTVAEKATEAWSSKNKQRDRTAAAREAKLLQQQQQAQAKSATEPIASVTTPVTENVTTSNRAEQSGAEKATPQPIAPAPSQREDFDKIEAACRQALGDKAPSNFVIGPMVSLVEQGLAIGAIVTVLRSEAARNRRDPVRTWKLWAEIVAKAVADQPKLALPTNGPDPLAPKIDLGWGPIPEANLIAQIKNPLKQWVAMNFGDTASFRAAIGSRAPHLMKFWPVEPAETSALEPAK